MKTIHYMSLTADGHVVRAETMGGIPPAILADFMGHVAQAGALIIGRRTYNLFQGLGAISSIPGVVVVISTSLAGDTEGVSVARSASEALEVVLSRGGAAAVVGGGPEIYSLFLTEGLIDGLVLNIVPAMDGVGLTIATAAPAMLALRLTGVSELDGGVAQLRYDREG